VYGPTYIFFEGRAASQRENPIQSIYFYIKTRKQRV